MLPGSSYDFGGTVFVPAQVGTGNVWVRGMFRSESDCSGSTVSLLDTPRNSTEQQWNKNAPRCVFTYNSDKSIQNKSQLIKLPQLRARHGPWANEKEKGPKS